MALKVCYILVLQCNKPNSEQNEVFFSCVFLLIFMQMKKEEKEEEVDVVGLEGVTTCGQENNDCVSASQMSAYTCALTTDDVLSSSPVVKVQDETSTIVKHIIDDVLDTMYKSINQCNSQEINMSG